MANIPSQIERHDLTTDQRQQLHDDLNTVEEMLQGISVLMSACYGSESQVAVRAEETAASLQRLKWELERIAKHAAEIPGLERAVQ